MKNSNRDQSSNLIEPLESRAYFSVDLTGSVSFLAPASKKVKPDQSVTIAVKVTNDGTTEAVGDLDVVASLSANADGSSPLESAPTSKELHLKQGTSIVVHAKIEIPTGFTPGTYFAVADIDPQNTFSETNIADKTAVSVQTLTVLDPYPNILGTWSGPTKITKGVGKGNTTTVVWVFNGESDTTGAITGSSTNYLKDGFTAVGSFSGYISTKGAFTIRGTDTPVDSAGEIVRIGKLTGHKLKGTYYNADSAGVFTKTFEG